MRPTRHADRPRPSLVHDAAQALLHRVDNTLRVAAGSTVRPPGPPIARGVRNLRDFFGEQVGFMQWMRQTYGPVSYVGFGRSKYYVICEPELIHEILVSRADLFDKDDRSLRDLSRIVGQGLLTSRGERWRRQRKLAAPHLKRAQISAYAQIMHQVTQDHLSLGLQGQVDLQHEMMSVTLQIVLQTLFRAELPSALDDIGQTLETLLEDFERRQHSLYRFVPPGLPTPLDRRYNKAKAHMDELIDKLIAHRRAEGYEGDDLLQRLIMACDDQGQGLTNEQLRDEVLTIFTAGHETTALTLSYALYELAKRQDLQALMRQELAALMRAEPEAAQDFALWASKLPMTRAIIMESLRLYPPAWIMSRESLVQTTLGAWQLPAHSNLIISPFLLHRDERFFDEPERFRPERWLDGELERTLPKHAFMPFGAGGRVCIGNHFAMMEAIIALATIISQRGLSRACPDTVEYSPAITLRPKTPLYVHMERVQDSEA